MRTPIVAGMVVLAVLAGCTGPNLDCPDEYGPEFEEIYLTVADKLEEAGTPIPDADGDCVSDYVEGQLGTNPEDAASHPTLEQLAEGPQGIPGLGNNTVPPPVVHEWKVETISGGVTTTMVVGPATTGGYVPGGLVVPDGALRTMANFTAAPALPGTELTIRLDTPDCALPEGCPDSLTETTSGGVASFDIHGPEAGGWTISFFAATGVFDGRWEAEVASLVPVAAPAAGSTGSTTSATTATTGSA